MHKHCPRCHQPMQLTDLSALSGKVGEVTVSIDWMPSLVCPQGHEHSKAKSFAGVLLEALEADASAN